ncbi:sensor histidine kinase [Zhouia sp. PK063]|uniref:sensor histidine kinase n=1 Tax=Zhouia sp. PK063 TaxID=3373602 RepID=UPI0037BDBCF1
MELKNNRLLIIAIHVMIWAMLFTLPYLLISGQEKTIYPIIEHNWIPLCFYAVIFYLNYFYLIAHVMFNRKLGWFILVNLSFIFLLIWANHELRAYLVDNFDVFKRPKDANHPGPPIKFFIYVETISFLIPLVFAIAIKVLERWFKTENERKEAANIKLQAELQHLKYQLQPHFFFNSLNNIYSLVDISPEQAKETIHSLSKLMRYLLYETNTAQVSLQKEIEFMEKYIELMKLRFSNKTQVYYSFPEHVQKVKVSPLMFISLIENAFKHGVSAKEESMISFDMKVTNNTITFISENKNLPKTETDKSGSGIGVQNLQKRLELLYFNKYEFNCGVYNEIFKATLILEI